MRPPAVLLGVMLCACAEGEPPPLRLDLAAERADLAAGFDLGPAQLDGLLLDGAGPDRQAADRGCALGSADHCGGCGKVCPPGQDTISTLRVCELAVCGLQCREEFYDVDGAVQNGCEIEDDLPVHDSASQAADLGQVSDCSGSIKTVGLLPSDDRLHLKSPGERAQGRPDWFKLRIEDKAGCVVDGSVRVALQALPAAASYRATAQWLCDGGKLLAPASKTGNGGSELQLDPSVSCTLIGDDSGTLLIELVKLSGPHSAAGYQIEIAP